MVGPEPGMLAQLVDSEEGLFTELDLACLKVVGSSGGLFEMRAGWAHRVRSRIAGTTDALQV